MSSAISSFLEVFKGDPSDLPPPVRFIPASYLFTHIEPLPEGTQANELENFAEVTLEALSPIPLEHLAWGYLVSEPSRRVLIFAAFRDRLTHAELAPDESFLHVLPGFFAAAPADGQGHWIFLWEAGHVAALRYDAGEQVPSRIEIEQLAEDTPAAAFAAREHLLKRLGAAAKNDASPGLLAKPEVVCGPNDKFSYSYSQYSAPEAEPARVEGHPPPATASRWSADLRGSLYRDTEQKRRRAVRQSARVLQVAALAAILCLVGQLAWGWIKYSNNRANKLIASRVPEENAILAKETLLKQIEKFTTHQLRPFEMLGEINNFRPPSVIFTKLVINTKTDNKTNRTFPVFTAQCQSTNTEGMTAFIDQLASFPDVALDREAIRPTTRGFGGVNFNVVLAYNKMPPAEEMPPPPPPPPPPEPEPTAAELAAIQAEMGANQPPQPGPPGGQPVGMPAAAPTQPVAVANPAAPAAPATAPAPAPAPAAEEEAPVVNQGPTVILSN